MWWERETWPRIAVIAGAVVISALVAGCGGANSSVTRLDDGSTLVAPSQAQLQAYLDAELARLGVDPSREVSVTPSAGSEVFDLTVDVVAAGEGVPDGGIAVELSWTERQLGDYNQDGLVSVNDLTALGQHFGASVEYADPAEYDGVGCWPEGDPEDGGADNWRLARIDGNGDGQIYLSDITTIAQHWGEQLSGYRLYHKPPGALEFSLEPNPLDPESELTVGRGQAVSGGPDAPVRYRLELNLPPAGGEHEFYVAACGAGGGEEGPPSPMVNPDFEPAPDPNPDPDPDPGPDPPSSGELLVIRDDDYNYGANYDAIISDLDELEIDYYEVDWYAGIPADFSAEDWDYVIWYRGGPGSVSEIGELETNPAATWTDDEIDDYIQLLSDGHLMVLMSQNHGRNPNVDFSFQYGDGWEIWYEAEYGWELLDGTIDDDGIRHPWAASLGTDKGVGLTGHVGFLESAPRNILATSEFGGRVPEGATNTYHGYDIPAECFSGSGSSGDMPLALSFGAGGQFTAVGYHYAFMKYHPYPNAGPYFHSGFSLVPPFEDDWSEDYDYEFEPDLAFISYGNSRAPDWDIGSFVTPEHKEGPGRLWVIGYPWAQTIITESDSGEDMTRAQILKNVLAWLMYYDDNDGAEE
jgi:hypothetical protein